MARDGGAFVSSVMALHAGCCRTRECEEVTILPNTLRFVPSLAGVVLSLLLLTPRLGHGENAGNAQMNRSAPVEGLPTRPSVTTPTKKLALLPSS